VQHDLTCSEWDWTSHEISRNGYIAERSFTDWRRWTQFDPVFPIDFTELMKNDDFGDKVPGEFDSTASFG
jgi:hypothetical protein